MAKIKYTSVIRKPKSLIELVHEMMRIQFIFLQSESPLVLDRATTETMLGMTPYVGKGYDLIDLTEETTDEEESKLDEAMDCDAKPAEQETKPSAQPLNEIQIIWLQQRRAMECEVCTATQMKEKLEEEIATLQEKVKKYNEHEALFTRLIIEGDEVQGYDAEEGEFN